jgi:ATP-binding cassette subfamily F protein uup
MNGAGKTSLFRALVGELPLAAGKRVQGSTVKIAYLSQALEELNPTWRVLEAVERVARRVELGKGRELSAAQLCEKLGFPPDAQWTPVGDLSGGERRRLQLTRLLMSEPNVLLLDEPTNDFDVETLTALEDLLDGFAGTLLVISHDRYFLERVCDRVYGLLGDHTLRDLPRGIDEYLELRAHSVAAGSPPNKAATADLAVDVTLSAADVRELKKEIQRLERTLSKLADKRTSLLTAMADVSHDYTKVADLQPQLTAIDTEIADVELRWLEISSNLEA